MISGGMTLRQIIQSVVIPELFRDVRLHQTAVLVWTRLYWSPVDTVAEHVKKLGLAPETLRRAVRTLIENEWAVEFHREGLRSPLIVPWMPPHVERMVVHEMRDVRREVGRVGEWTLECILCLAVDDRDFRRNVRPEWFTLGVGEGRMEIDFWFRRRRVAIEFQGRQHYEYEPEMHENRREFMEQQRRDNIKAGLCLRHGIHYIEIPAHELSIDYVREKVQGVLPLRPFPGDSPVVRAINEMCLSYVNTVHRKIGQ